MMQQLFSLISRGLMIHKLRVTLMVEYLFIENSKNEKVFSNTCFISIDVL